MTKPTITSQEILEVLRDSPGLTAREVAIRLPQRYANLSIQTKDIATRLGVLHMKGSVVIVSSHPNRWAIA